MMPVMEPRTLYLLVNAVPLSYVFIPVVNTFDTDISRPFDMSFLDFWA